MKSLILLLYMTYHFLFVPQVRMNDCGTSSMLMVARHYERGFDRSTGEWQYEITEGKDRALHFTEVVWYLEQEYGILLNISYSWDDLYEAQSNGDPTIILIRNKAHYAVLHEWVLFDPRDGIQKYTPIEFWENVFVENNGVLFVVKEVYER